LTERQLRNLEADGLFPKRFLIAPNGRAVGWSANEVAAWLAERVERREQPSKTGMAKPGQRIGAAA
jgi:predicted DNA-binding transcriptional regulator AlpA